VPPEPKGRKRNEIWSDFYGTEAMKYQAWTNANYELRHTNSTTRSAKENPSTPQTKVASVGCVTVLENDLIFKVASREHSL
jgi:hypothetical protein